MSKQEPKTFLMNLDWYDEIMDCTDEEKAWLLTSIYEYQVCGMTTETDNRVLRNMFRTMRRFFDSASESYKKTCEINKLNADLGWKKQKLKDAKESGDTTVIPKLEAQIEQITERKKFLNDKKNTFEDYTTAYDRMPSDATACDRMPSDAYINTNVSTGINDNSRDSENSNLNPNTIHKDITDSIDKDMYESEGLRERKQVSLPELQQYHDEHGYTFNCRNVLNAMTKPLYQDELQAKCDFWENTSKK